MRHLLLAALIAVPSVAIAGHPVPLVPIGIPFAPSSPEPVSPTHPLYHRIAVMPVAGIPKRVGGTFTLSIRQAEFDTALRDTLDKLNMLAPTDADARFRLTTTWGDLDMPFHIGISSHATARLSYTLARTDTGQSIFAREIATSAESKGGDATDREQETGRLALMTNLASVAVCLDQAAYGRAPADCALKPLATYRARSVPLIMFVPRR